MNELKAVNADGLKAVKSLNLEAVAWLRQNGVCLLLMMNRAT